jgi:hypothetical protein
MSYRPSGIATGGHVEQQWDYRSGRSGANRDQIAKELARWAEDGWELASTVFDSESAEIIYFWRRHVG